MPSSFDGAVTNPDGSVYFPNGNFTVLSNGIMLAGKPSPGDIQRFAKFKIPSGGVMKDPSLLQGAVRYPSGGVYLPKGDFFVLPNGHIVANTPAAKDFVPKALNFPKTIPKPPATGGGGKPPVTPPPGEKPGTPPPAEPPPGEKPGFPPPGGGPSPSPLPGDDNFLKGQARDESMPGDYFSPFYEAFYGSNKDYDPYNGAGGKANIGGATGYDPLGIGEGAYNDPNASYYPMEGVNSALGADPGNMRTGLVGGNGGYGTGMVGQDYSGPIFGDTREVMKAMRKQRKALNRTQKAKNVNPVEEELDKWGQPKAPVTPATPAKPTKQGKPPVTPTPTTPTTPAVPRLPDGTPDYSKMRETQRGQYRANVDGQDLDLVQSSDGMAGIYKVNGAADDGRRYHFDKKTNRWKSMSESEYRGYGDTQYWDIDQADEATRRAAGQQYGNTFQRTGSGTKPQTSGTYVNGKWTATPMKATSTWAPNTAAMPQGNPANVRRGGGRIG